MPIDVVVDETWWHVLLDVVVGVGGLLGVVVPFVLYFRERADRIAAQSEAKMLRAQAARDAQAHQARRFATWVEDEWPKVSNGVWLCLFNSSDAPIHNVNADLYVGAVRPAFPGAQFEVEVEIVPPSVTGSPMRVNINSHPEVQRAIQALGNDRANLRIAVDEFDFFDAAQRAWTRDGNNALVLGLRGGKGEIIDGA